MSTTVDGQPPLRREGPAGEEELRFIRNFHDIFIAIGIVILGVALQLLAAEAITSQEDDIDTVLGFAVVASLSQAAIMWLLAEYFASRRRLFFPAIALCLFYASNMYNAILTAYVLFFFPEGLIGPDYEITGLMTALEGEGEMALRLYPSLAAGMMALSLLLFYVRFKLPFSAGLTGAAIVSAIALSPIVFVDSEVLEELAPFILAGSGWLLFFVGLAFDARDPERRTRYSDNGFWLNFFAAPAIFIGTFWIVGAGFFGMDSGDDGAAITNAVVTLAVILVFAIISLLTNRRALLVSGLVTAGIAIGTLVFNTGMETGVALGITLLLLGGFVVLLGAGWHATRRFLLKPFPKTGPIARVFPPEPKEEADRQ